MQPIYSIGEIVVFVIAKDIDVLVIEREEDGRGVSKYRVVWINNGDRKDAWVSGCELARRGSEAE